MDFLLNASSDPNLLIISFLTICDLLISAATSVLLLILTNLADAFILLSALFAALTALLPISVNEADSVPIEGTICLKILKPSKANAVVKAPIFCVKNSAKLAKNSTTGPCIAFIKSEIATLNLLNGFKKLSASSLIAPKLPINCL